MLKPMQDGSLHATLPLYTKLPYDISNQRVLAQADGSFAVSRYAAAGYHAVFEPDSFYAAAALDGKAIPYDAQKHIRMEGRTQQIELAADNIKVECETFLDEATQAVYQHYRLHNSGNTASVFCLSFGFLFSAELTAEDGTHFPPVTAVPNENGLLHTVAGRWPFTLACSQPLQLREIEGRGIHYQWSAQLPPGSEVPVQLVYHLHETNDQLTPAALLAGFDNAYRQATGYCAYLRSRLCGENPTQRALFSSALNCAISSYKAVGRFKGFYAGVHYMSPPRTYYRDGYFTILPVLPHKPELVRDEILTLALGISASGSCPSAVVDEHTVFWENHLDSPAYFVLMLHDYLAATRDFALLDTEVKGSCILQWMQTAVDGMLKQADNNHLLYRQPGNRHDWVDNIYREGYVTYIQLLFYRAVHCAGRILHHTGNPGYAAYAQQAQQIKDAINRLLWNDAKGWYNNYSSHHCTEDNLSIDTVLAIWFGVADDQQTARLLTHMEHLLESRNNAGQPFGDWGTMCCFPFYQYPAHLVEKSAYPFVYHNGSDWPYWSAAYAFAKQLAGLPFEYPLTRWFTYSLEQGWATPVEYYNPVSGKGSYLQGWSGMAAFTLYHAQAGTFPYNL